MAPEDPPQMTLGVPGACPSQVSVWGVGSQFASFCSRPVAPASWEAIGLDLHPWSAPTARGGAGAGPGWAGAPRGQGTLMENLFMVLLARRLIRSWAFIDRPLGRQFSLLVDT